MTELALEGTLGRTAWAMKVREILGDNGRGREDMNEIRGKGLRRLGN